MLTHYNLCSQLEMIDKLFMVYPEDIPAGSCDKHITMEYCVDGVATDVTMTLKEWSDCLNGATVTIDGVEYNYGDGIADVQVRLNILAACEGKILESYNYLPMLQDGSMALLSQQVYYVVEEYNGVLGRGGIAYTRYAYNEADWAKYVADQGGELKY